MKDLVNQMFGSVCHVFGYSGTFDVEIVHVFHKSKKKFIFYTKGRTRDIILVLSIMELQDQRI